MPLIRPEALATLTQWREVMIAAGLGAFGLWLIFLGGLVLGPIGLVLLALAGVLGLTAWRRMRFQQTVAAPGLVEVVEGQVSYFGPALGGTISLDDLAELRLVTLRGRRMWRLKQSDGQALLIPVDASGAETLFDAFTSLPDMDMPALLAALSPAPGSSPLPTVNERIQVLWRRKGAGIVGI